MLSLTSSLFHLFAEAEWSHVSPHFLDVFKAFRLGTAISCISPTERIISVGRPDGILLLVIYDHFVKCGVFFVVSIDHIAINFY
jgi:hypothetical protein